MTVARREAASKRMLATAQAAQWRTERAELETEVLMSAIGGKRTLRGEITYVWTSPPVADQGPHFGVNEYRFTHFAFADPLCAPVP